MSDKEQIVKDTANYGIARYFILVISFIAGIIQKRMLGPTLTGIWNALALVKMYTQFGEVGVREGVELKLPVFYARKDVKNFEKFQDIAFSFSTLIIILVNIVIFIASFFIATPQNHLYAIGLRLIAVVAILEYIAAYMETASLRCKNKFSLLGTQIIRAEIIFSVISLFGIYFFKLNGLIASFGMMLLYKIFFIIRKTKDRYSLVFNGKVTFELLKMGFPLIIFALVMRTFENLDRIVIIKYLNLEMLGYYSIALMVFISINDFPLIVGRIFYPRIVNLFGEEKDRHRLIGYLVKIQYSLMLITMALAGIVFFVFPILIKYFLVKFIYGIQSLKILVFSVIFSSLLYLPVQCYIVMNKRWRLVWVLGAISFLYFLVLSNILNKNFLGMKDIDLVALIRVAINFLFSTIMSFLVFYSLKSLKKFRIYIFRVFLFSAYFILSVIFIDSLFSNKPLIFVDDLKILCIKIILFAILFIPLVLVVNRETEIFNILREVYLYKRKDKKQEIVATHID